MAADPVVLERIVATLLAAESPWIMAEFTGRQPGNFDKLVTLAETLAVAVGGRQFGPVLSQPAQAEPVHGYP